MPACQLSAMTGLMQRNKSTQQKGTPTGVFSSFSMVGGSAVVAAAVRGASRRVSFFMAVSGMLQLLRAGMGHGKRAYRLCEAIPRQQLSSNRT
jgi:hypothetical protein